MKSAIFNLNLSRETTGSDPRLQSYSVNETVNKV